MSCYLSLLNIYILNNDIMKLLLDSFYAITQMLCTICMAMGTIFKCTMSVFLSKENAKRGSSSCIFIEDI